MAKDVFVTIRNDDPMLLAGRMASMAMDIDLDGLLKVAAANPGPEFYIQLLGVTVAFVEEVRRIEKELGHQRIRLQAVPLVVPPAGGLPS